MRGLIDRRACSQQLDSRSDTWVDHVGVVRCSSARDDAVLKFATKKDQCVDDLTGSSLPPNLCKAARKKDIDDVANKAV